MTDTLTPTRVDEASPLLTEALSVGRELRIRSGTLDLSQPVRSTQLRIEEEPERRRSRAGEVEVGGSSRDAVLALIGAAVSGLGAGLVLTVGIGLIPVGWLFVLSYVWFVGIYSALVWANNSRLAVRDRYWTVLLWSAGVVVVASLALVIGFIFIRGSNVFLEFFSAASGQSLLERFHFLTTDMMGVSPLAGLDEGGILHAIVGTLIQIGIAFAITFPLGLLTAVFLNEVGGKYARFVRTIVEAMTALPSVVAGLFIYAAIIVGITKEFNGFAASLAITVLMLPIMIRSSDVVLRLVPGNLRDAGLALGASQWRVVWHIVLPTVRSGLTTAIILATAHGIGETAPVLLTSGVTSYLNFDPFHDPMISLPLQALEFVRSPQPAMIARGFATAAVLLFLVLVLFILARIVGGSAMDRLGGSSRRLDRLSRQIATRHEQRAARRAAAPSPLAALDSKDLAS